MSCQHVSYIAGGMCEGLPLANLAKADVYYMLEGILTLALPSSRLLAFRKELGIGGVIRVAHISGLT